MLFPAGSRWRRWPFRGRFHAEVLDELVEELLGGPRCRGVRMCFRPLQGKHKRHPAVQSLCLGWNTEAGQACKEAHGMLTARVAVRSASPQCSGAEVTRYSRQAIGRSA